MLASASSIFSSDHFSSSEFHVKRLDIVDLNCAHLEFWTAAIAKPTQLSTTSVKHELEYKPKGTKG